MQFIDFKNILSLYPVFSLQDIRKNIPQFNRVQLDRWERKGHLRKIKQGFYSFINQPPAELFLFFTANKIYSPSYISLEKALKFYGLIPEEIIQITSLSTKKTTHFATSIGDFSYRHIKPSLFWGYKMIKYDKHNVLMAEPEKAILDYLYLNPHLKIRDDFIEMRINTTSFKEYIDIDKFHTYLKAFKNKALSRRANIFLDTI